MGDAQGDSSMSESRYVDIKPRFPLFWQAIYPENLNELKIPICMDCGSLIKVSSYDDLVCPNTVQQADTNTYEMCGSANISFEEDDGALVIPLQYGVLNEFDEDGNEPINFRYLPTAGLQVFGLIDPVVNPPTMYMVNLRTGNLEIGNVNTGRAIPVGVGIEFPTVNGINLIPISMVLNRYGDGGDLIHYKHGIQSGMAKIDVRGKEPTVGGFSMDPGSSNITNIVVGYKCRIPGWSCQVKINVDCATHLPFITTKATRTEE
jgi:hypothetical protein